MIIRRMVCNPLQENCYVVSDDSSECVIIDCGAFFPEEHDALRRYIRQEALRPVHLLATHGHLDHLFGNQMVYEEYGLRVEICAEDRFLIDDLPGQASSMFGMRIPERQPGVSRWLADGDSIAFGSHRLRVIQTPGHTPGSALFYCEEEQVVFTGDTLFRRSIGRTDLEGGSWPRMAESLRTRVAVLPGDTVVMSGHGPQTTIGEELTHNPYLRG